MRLSSGEPFRYDIPDRGRAPDAHRQHANGSNMPPARAGDRRPADVLTVTTGSVTLPKSAKDKRGDHVAMKVKVVVHQAEEGGYWAEVPSIPGCATQGETFEELLMNLYPL